MVVLGIVFKWKIKTKNAHVITFVYKQNRAIYRSKPYQCSYFHLQLYDWPPAAPSEYPTIKLQQEISTRRRELISGLDGQLYEKLLAKYTSTTKWVRKIEAFTAVQIEIREQFRLHYLARHAESSTYRCFWRGFA